MAQSLYHDIAPATALGLDTVWIDRHDGHGSGATPRADATPKWTLRNLARTGGSAVVTAGYRSALRRARADASRRRTSTRFERGRDRSFRQLERPRSAAAFSSCHPATMSSRSAPTSGTASRHAVTPRSIAIDIRLHRQVQRDRVRRNRHREVAAHRRAVQIHRARRAAHVRDDDVHHRRHEVGEAQSLCPQRRGRHHRRQSGHVQIVRLQRTGVGDDTFADLHRRLDRAHRVRRGSATSVASDATSIVT